MDWLKWSMCKVWSVQGDQLMTIISTLFIHGALSRRAEEGKRNWFGWTLTENVVTKEYWAFYWPPRTGSNLYVEESLEWVVVSWLVFIGCLVSSWRVCGKKGARRVSGKSGWVGGTVCGSNRVSVLVKGRIVVKVKIKVFIVWSEHIYIWR